MTNKNYFKFCLFIFSIFLFSSITIAGDEDGTRPITRQPGSETLELEGLVGSDLTKERQNLATYINKKEEKNMITCEPLYLGESEKCCIPVCRTATESNYRHRYFECGTESCQSTTCTLGSAALFATLFALATNAGLELTPSAQQIGENALAACCASCCGACFLPHGRAYDTNIRKDAGCLFCCGIMSSAALVAYPAYSSLYFPKSLQWAGNTLLPPLCQAITADCRDTNTYYSWLLKPCFSCKEENTDHITEDI